MVQVIEIYDWIYEFEVFTFSRELNEFNLIAIVKSIAFSGHFIFWGFISWNYRFGVLVNLLKIHNFKKRITFLAQIQ